MSIPITAWGKDHWSLLAYVEGRCVDHNNALDPRHMRQDGNRYPTRCNGFQLVGHSDYDCLNDLDAAGLVIAGSAGMAARMTEQGSEIAGQLRAYKAQGGNFATFKPKVFATFKPKVTV